MSEKLEPFRFTVPRVPRVLHAAYFVGILVLLVLTIKSSFDEDYEGMFRNASLATCLVLIEITYLLLRLLGRVKKIEGALKDFYSPAINDLRRDFYETQDLHLRHLEKLLINRSSDE
jgi:hypothetical protein